MSSATRIGTTVAGYRLEAQLGQGGMSVVYLAEHPRLGRKVALKLLAPALSSDMAFRERFEREWRRSAEIDHPNIVPVYDAGEADGEMYIAMRYVRGSDLKSLIARDGPLSVGRALFILEQVAAALDAAHDRDLIHRDVKPANILIEEPSERVYVTDFGVVKHTLSRGHTKTGYFVGTTDYAAPEQIEGRPVDARTDVYALGCVLYECLTGKPPFERESDIGVMHAHLSMAPPAVSDVHGELPKALDRVIARAMAKPKEERYATCSELIQAARGAVLDQVTSAPPEERAAGAVLPTLAPGSAAGTVASTSESPAPPPPVQEPPAAEPPAAGPPPPSVPATSGGGGPSRGRSWTIGVAAAVAAAVAAGLIVFFVTRSDSDSGSTVAEPATTAAATTTNEPGTTAADTGSTATEPAETTGTETTGTETVTASGAETELAALVPAELWSSCAVANEPRAGAEATAVCLQPEGGDGASRQPDRWELSIYPDAASLKAAYDDIEAGQGLTPGTGRCNGVSWGGDGPWEHGPDKPGGHRLCYFDGNDAVMVWTHEKLDQPDHRDVLGIAVEGGSDHASLFSWWRFWHHRIGKVEA